MANAKINPDLEPLARPLADLHCDPKNARKHGKRDLDTIAASLDLHGQQKPIVAMRDGKVIAGNGTLEAARALGWDRIACVTYDDEDAAKAAAFAIVDNRSAELSEWDTDALAAVLAEIPPDLLGAVGFIPAELDDLLHPQTPYTRKITPPIYEPRNAKPPVGALMDRSKTADLLRAIDAADLPDDVVAFLRSAAERHTVFDFGRIADFYAHSAPATQRLFEHSALVIIDINQAIECGFVDLSTRLLEIAGLDSAETRDAP